MKSNELQEFTVTFNLGYNTDREPPESITVMEGKAAGDLFPQNPSPRPSAVNEPEWTFAGWYNYADVYSKDTPITKNLELKARWSFQNTGNPLIKHMFTADPAPLVVGDTVYLYTGHDEHFRDQDYFTMYDWYCFSTKDMKTWIDHGPILHREAFSWNRKPLSAETADAWAAHMVERDGKFYYYVTVRTDTAMAVGVAVGSSPLGPFVDAIGKPLISGHEPVNGQPADQLDAGWGKDIDPAVWIDEKGQAYMVWGNPQREWCLFVKLKNNMVELDGPITTLPMINYTEGPWLYQRGGHWYNVYPSHAHQGSHEKISYAMAKDVYGPWEHKGEITGTAHNSYTIHPGIIEFKGQPYFFYHNGGLTLNVDGVNWGPATGRRSVCVEYMYYNEDGTIKPIIQTKEGITVPPEN